MYGRASDTRVKFSVIKNAQKSAPRESTGPRITTLATGAQVSEGRGNQRKMNSLTVGKQEDRQKNCSQGELCKVCR